MPLWIGKQTDMKTEQFPICDWQVSLKSNRFKPEAATITIQPSGRAFYRATLRVFTRVVLNNVWSLSLYRDWPLTNPNTNFFMSVSHAADRNVVQGGACPVNQNNDQDAQLNNVHWPNCRLRHGRCLLDQVVTLLLHAHAGLSCIRHTRFTTISG